MSLTWEDMKEKYPEQRDEMSEEREKSFVEDCFSCYEQGGFAKKFWTPFSDYANRISQKFKVVGCCTTESQDLCTLPMWLIQFKDGKIIGAYPEEIIPFEMRANGCKLKHI